MLTVYYQKNPKKLKKSLQKGLIKCTKIFLKKKKNKNRQYACEQYRNLSEEEKEKGHYGHERYKNFLENEKQRLVEHINSYSTI